MKRNAFAVFTIILITLQLPIMSSDTLGMQSENNSEIHLTDSDFGVEITYVGYSAFSQDEVEPTPTNVYDFVTDFIILSITIKIDVVGYTSWNLGNVTMPDISAPVNFASESITAGQLFMQVDNTVEILHENSLTNLGLSVPLTIGDHTISILYIGYGDTGVVYAKDEIVVRIRTNQNDFDTYITTTYQLDVAVNDTSEQQNFSGEVISNITTSSRADLPDRFIYYLENLLSPSMDVSIFLGDFDLEINNSLSVIPGDMGPTVVTMNGALDTYGFSGLQNLREWEKTQGLSFLIDAEGLHPLFETTKIVIRRGLNFIGVLSLLPYGLWHEKIPCLDKSTCEGEPYGLADWQGTIIEDSDSSFDFVGKVVGSVNFISIQEPVETTETEESGVLLNLSLFSIATLILIRRREKL